jgi:hypothetical protein
MLMHRSTFLRLFPLSFLAATLSCGSDGGGSTGPTPNPVPTLTSLSRDTAMAGATPFVITLRGTGFVPGISATIGGLARTTTRASDTVATVQTVAADLTTAATREVQVTNPEPGGGTSGALNLTIHPAPPVPVLDSITPDTARQGGTARTLHAWGSQFQSTSRIRWNGVDLTTTFHSSTHLAATVTTGMIAVVDTIPVAVRTPAPGGGTSATRNFRINPVPPVAVISGVTPFPLMAAFDTITITVRGEHFLGADTVWLANNGVTQVRIPAAVTDTSLEVTLDRSVLQPRTFLTVAIHNPGGTNVPQSVFLFNRPLTVTGLAPDTVDVAQAVDTLVVTGTNFTSRTKSKIGTIPLATELVDASTIRLMINGENLLNTVAATWVRLYDEENEANRDSILGPVIRYPVPVLDSVAPSIDSVGAGPRHVIIHGANLSGLGTPRVNGAARSYDPDNSGPSQMRIQLEAADFTIPDTLAITFENPGPGGGTSNSVTIAIVPPNPVPQLYTLDRPYIPTDSGAIQETVTGAGFIAGTTIELTPLGAPSAEPVSLPTQILDDSTAIATIPPSELGAPRSLWLRARAPAPTAEASAPIAFRTLGTGVRSATVREGYFVDVTGRSAGGDLFAIMIQNSAFWVHRIDPATGATEDSTLMQGTPQTLELASDGTALYIAGMLGGLLALDPQTLDTLYHLPAGLTPDSVPWQVISIAAGRDHPDRVALIRGPSASSTAGFQVVIVEDGVALPGIVDLAIGYGNLALDFAPGDTLLVGVTRNRSSGAHYLRFSVGDLGAAQLLDTSILIETGLEIVVTGGIVHTANGTAIDLATGALAPGSALGSQWRLARGRAADRAYAVRLLVAPDEPEPMMTVHRLGTATAPPLGTARVPLGLGLTQGIGIWGPDGFAVAGSLGLLIGRSSATDQ